MEASSHLPPLLDTVYKHSEEKTARSGNVGHWPLFSSSSPSSLLYTTVRQAQVLVLIA
jgi:hypothetical protein